MLAVLYQVTYNPSMFDNENDFMNLSDEAPKDFNDIDAAFTDPFVTRVLDMVRTYNRIFQENIPTDQEKDDIINELDHEWGSIKDTAIRFTGNIRVRDNDNREEIKVVFLDGADVVSNGFCIENETINGIAVSKVKYHLLVSFKDAYGIDASEDAKVGVTGATGDIDSSSIELDIASPERAKAWLTISCPLLIEEIDFRALNGPGGEDDAILSLKDLDFNEYADLNDEFTRNCLNIYLQSIIEVDKEVPYSSKLDGAARNIDDQSLLYNIKSDNALIKVNSIALQPAFNLDEADTRWSLAALISLLDESRVKETEHYFIPVDAFRDLQSIRTAYYGTNT